MKFKSPEWNAWYNMQPQNPSTLNITALIDLEDTSSDLDLKFHSILKRRPPILVLKLERKTIFVPRDDQDTVVRVVYSQTARPGDFHSVMILDENGNTIKEIPESDITIAW